MCHRKNALPTPVSPPPRTQPLPILRRYLLGQPPRRHRRRAAPRRAALRISPPRLIILHRQHMG